MFVVNIRFSGCSLIVAQIAQQLVQSMQRHIADVHVQEHACDALAELSVGSSPALGSAESAVLLKSGAVASIYASMAAHPASYAVHAGVGQA